MVWRSVVKKVSWSQRLRQQLLYGGQLTCLGKIMSKYFKQRALFYDIVGICEQYSGIRVTLKNTFVSKLLQRYSVKVHLLK